MKMIINIIMKTKKIRKIKIASITKRMRKFKIIKKKISTKNKNRIWRV
jgi:hypothetical protein